MTVFLGVKTFAIMDNDQTHKKEKENLHNKNIQKEKALKEILMEGSNLQAEYKVQEQERIRKEREEKEKLAKVKKEKIERAKRNIAPYTYGHKIFAEKKYVPIDIPEKYQKYFSTAEVITGDNYWTIFERVFGKKIWGGFSSVQKNKYVAYGEKISRVGRYNLKKGMNLVLPNSPEGLSFAPVTSKLSEKYMQEVLVKREQKIGQYWIDFGSDYGNKIFQSRAGKKSDHILIINRKTQYFGMYKNGALQNWGPISSGKVGNGTPAGFYVSLWYKDMWHSKTYGDAEMPNAVNYDPDGFFTHAGVLPGYPQSHGCPRVLKGDSEKIFSVAKSEVFPIIVL